METVTTRLQMAWSLFHIAEGGVIIVSASPFSATNS